MTATEVQAAIETTLGTVDGLTVTDKAVSGTVETRSLPATTAIFEGYDDVQLHTMTAERTGTWRVPVYFAMSDPARFKSAMVTVIPAIYAAFEDAWSGDGTVEVTDGGEPEIVNDSAAATVARKVLFVRVTFEEPRSAA